MGSRSDRVLTTPFLLAVAGTLGVFLSIGMLLPVLPVYAKGPLHVDNVGIGLAVPPPAPQGSSSSGLPGASSTRADAACSSSQSRC